MSQTTDYSFTENDLQHAFEQLSETLFDVTRDISAESLPAPKVLMVAGAQGSGKTYLLENSLLPSLRYQNHVRLYLPVFRELHPHYAQMIEQGTLHAYEHTENFIWRLGARVCEYALEHRYNIIMETALDDPKFADFPPVAVAAGYQFEVHMIACQKEFCHWATLDRAMKSLEENTLERFVPLSRIEASQANARIILDAFEDACREVAGSQITLYRRGLETGMESKVLCHSQCSAPFELLPQLDYFGEAFISAPELNRIFSILRTPSADAPCSYPQYTQVVHAGMIDPELRLEMVKVCCKTLGRARQHAGRVPTSALRELCLYILKYAQP